MAIQYSGNLIPAMTSATAPSGVVNANGMFSALQAPYMAFDRMMNVAGMNNIWQVEGKQGWISYRFQEAKKICKYTIKIWGGGDTGVNRAPSSWSFQGSNDAITWIDLHSVSGVTDWNTTSQVKKEFTFDNANSFLFYRINISNTKLDNYIAIDEIEMMERILITRHLIKSLNKIQTLSGGNWIDVGIVEPLSKTDFINHGMPDLNITTKLDELGEEFEVITWTQNMDMLGFIEIQTDNFLPTDVLKDEGQFELLTFTDSPNLVQSSINVVAETKNLYQVSKDNINWYGYNGTDFIQDYQMTKTQFQTVPPAKFNQLFGESIYKTNLYIKCILYSQIPNNNLTIRNITVNYASNQYPIIINPLASADQIHNEYVTVSATIKDLEGDLIQYRILIKKAGEADFYVANDWDTVNNNSNILRAYNQPYFKLGTNIIRLETKDQRGSVSSWDTNLVLTSQIPLINYTYTPFGFIGTISDPDSDKVAIQISVNGNIVLPFSDQYMTTPKLFKYEWDNSLINIGQSNTIKIELKDHFGAYTSEEFTIIGEHKNILFLDENNNLYSTESGERLKLIDFGRIVAGYSSPITKITIKNNTNYTLERVNISTIMQTPNVPQHIKIFFSEQQEPFIAQEELEMLQVLNQGDIKDICVQIQTTSGGSGINLANANILADGKIVRE